MSVRSMNMLITLLANVIRKNLKKRERKREKILYEKIHIYRVATFSFSCSCELPLESVSRRVNFRAARTYLEVSRINVANYSRGRGIKGVKNHLSRGEEGEKKASFVRKASFRRFSRPSVGFYRCVDASSPRIKSTLLRI